MSRPSRSEDPCRGKDPHASEALARNMAELHAWTHPACEGTSVYPCGDHWHWGHLTAGVKQRCRRGGEVRAFYPGYWSHRPRFRR